MAPNRYPTVVNGAAVDADAWFNSVGIDLTTLYNESRPQGWAGSSTLTSSASTSAGTEVVAYSLTFTAVGGRRYKLTYDCTYQGTVGGSGEAMAIRMRWAVGASVTTSDTRFRIKAVNPATTTNPLTFVGEVTGIPAGQATVGITIQRTAGSGTYTLNGIVDANEGFLLLEDIGV